MKLIPGTQLTPNQEAIVKSRFVHWHYSGQSWEAWRDSHAFHFRKDGQLSGRHHYAEPYYGH